MNDWNKTSKFLIPTIILSSVGKEIPLQSLGSVGLVNAYLGDDHLDPNKFEWINDKNTNYLFLLFRTNNVKLFSKEETVYKRFTSWIDYYDISDNLIMHVFKPKDKYQNDIELFKLGKYSEFSSELKEKYLSQLAKGIVNKDEMYRKKMSSIYGIDIPQGQELLSIPYDHEEIYRYNSLKHIYD